MVNPNPEPPFLEFLDFSSLTKGLKICFFISSLKPIPSSLTIILTLFSSFFRLTKNLVPFLLYLTLFIKLPIALSSLLLSNSK